jgi:cytochrome P450
MIYVFSSRNLRSCAYPGRTDSTSSASSRTTSRSFGAYYCIGAARPRTEISRSASARCSTAFPLSAPATDSFEWRNTLQLRGPQTLEVAW